MIKIIFLIVNTSLRVMFLEFLNYLAVLFFKKNIVNKNVSSFFSCKQVSISVN